jgi:hypothetical protein
MNHRFFEINEMKIVLVDIAELMFDEENSFLYIRIVEDASLNRSNMQECFDSIKDLTSNKPHFALIDASQHFVIQPDTLQYLVNSEIASGRRASAYYNVSMANRLTINFLKYLYPRPFCVQMFETQDPAIEWLKTIKSESQANS